MTSLKTQAERISSPTEQYKLDGLTYRVAEVRLIDVDGEAFALVTDGVATYDAWTDDHDTRWAVQSATVEEHDTDGCDDMVEWDAYRWVEVTCRGRVLSAGELVRSHEEAEEQGVEEMERRGIEEQEEAEELSEAA
jgi:hypothetical protein